MFQWYPGCVTFTAFCEHTKHCLSWKQSPMTTARNLRKKIALSLCTSYLKRIPFFFQQSLSSALSGFSVACIPHTSKTTLKHFAHPVGLFQIAAARDSVYVCLCVLVHTPRSSKSWCFFFLWPEPDGEIVFHLGVYMYIHIYRTLCVHVCVILGWGFVGGCTCVYVLKNPAFPDPNLISTRPQP